MFVRPRTADLALRMNEKLSDRITGEPSPRATASSSNQATDSVVRALLSDEAGQDWLASLLQQQRQASERQILRQHEMLRDYFGVTLRADVTTIIIMIADYYYDYYYYYGYSYY